MDALSSLLITLEAHTAASLVRSAGRATGEERAMFYTAAAVWYMSKSTTHRFCTAQDIVREVDDGVLPPALALEELEELI